MCPFKYLQVSTQPQLQPITPQVCTTTTPMGYLTRGIVWVLDTNSPHKCPSTGEAGEQIQVPLHYLRYSVLGIKPAFPTIRRQGHLEFFAGTSAPHLNVPPLLWEGRLRIPVSSIQTTFFFFAIPYSYDTTPPRLERQSDPFAN
jgi:hypothetical protein